jgi:hypothetical protein
MKNTTRRRALAGRHAIGENSRLLDAPFRLVQSLKLC